MHNAAEVPGQFVRGGSEVIRIPVHNRAGEVVAHALVDDGDAVWAATRRWYLSSGYPATGRYDRMHNLILGAKGVDHINGDKLDNRRSNLRLATQAQNCQNVRTAKGEYRGVYFDKTATHRPWYGQVKHNGVRHSAGFHATRDEARDAVQALRAHLLPFCGR